MQLAVATLSVLPALTLPPPPPPLQRSLLNDGPAALAAMKAEVEREQEAQRMNVVRVDCGGGCPSFQWLSDRTSPRLGNSAAAKWCSLCACHPAASGTWPILVRRPHAMMPPAVQVTSTMYEQMLRYQQAMAAVLETARHQVILAEKSPCSGTRQEKVTLAFPLWCGANGAIARAGC